MPNLPRRKNYWLSKKKIYTIIKELWSQFGLWLAVWNGNPIYAYTKIGGKRNTFEIKTWLKKSEGKFFSAEEIATQNNIRLKSLYSKLNNLKSDSDILTREMDLGGRKGIVTLYSFRKRDHELESVVEEYKDFKKSKLMKDKHPDTIVSLLILSKLEKIFKKIKEMMKSGSKEWI